MIKRLPTMALGLVALSSNHAVGEEQTTADWLFGCWWWKAGGDSIAAMELCIRPDFTAGYWRIESDGHGGDGELE